jgi:putative acetyltransferase
MKSPQYRPFAIMRNLGGREVEIASVVREAFARRYGTGDDEAALIASLRSDGDVVVELAAVEDDRIIGHVMFSRMACDPPLCRIAALAPVAVRIDRQSRGIGEALIREGLAACRAEGVEAVMVLGDPSYYGRFGFDAAPAASIASPYAGPHLQVLESRAGILRGVKSVAHARAFTRTGG